MFLLSTSKNPHIELLVRLWIHVELGYGTPNKKGPVYTGPRYIKPVRYTPGIPVGYGLGDGPRKKDFMPPRYHRDKTVSSAVF
jgi:hypothetical protein